MMRITPSRRLNRVAVGAVIAAAAVGIAGVAISHSAGTPPEKPDPATIAALRQSALEIAKTNGEASPFGGKLVKTNRQAFVGLAGGEVPFNDEVFAVELHGNFTSNRSHPPGLPAPTGSVLTLTFDASTLELRDFVLSRAALDLARLGELIPLDG